MDRKSAAIVSHQGGQLPKHACSNVDSFVPSTHVPHVVPLRLLWLVAGQ